MNCLVYPPHTTPPIPHPAKNSPLTLPPPLGCCMNPLPAFLSLFPSPLLGRPGCLRGCSETGFTVESICLKRIKIMVRGWQQWPFNWLSLRHLSCSLFYLPLECDNPFTLSIQCLAEYSQGWALGRENAIEMAVVSLKEVVCPVVPKNKTGSQGKAVRFTTNPVTIVNQTSYLHFHGMSIIIEERDHEGGVPLPPYIIKEVCPSSKHCTIFCFIHFLQGDVI